MRNTFTMKPIDFLKEEPKSLFTENELLKWLIGGMSTVLTGMSIFLGKMSFRFLKNRNDKLDKIDKRMSKIENVIFFKNSKGLDTNITEYVRHMNHDTSVQNTLNLVLDRIEEFTKKFDKKFEDERKNNNNNT